MMFGAYTVQVEERYFSTMALFTREATCDIQVKVAYTCTNENHFQISVHINESQLHSALNSYSYIKHSIHPIAKVETAFKKPFSSLPQWSNILYKL